MQRPAVLGQDGAVDSPVARLIRASRDQLCGFKPIHDPRDGGAVDCESCTQFGAALAVLLPERMQDGVLNGCDAEGRELVACPSRNLLSGFADQEADAVFDAVHRLVLDV